MVKQNELINENDSQFLGNNSYDLDLNFGDISNSLDDEFFRNENFLQDNEKTNIIA